MVGNTPLTLLTLPDQVHQSLQTNHLHIEKALFDRVADGDEQAFEQLYDLLKPRIAGYVMKLVKSETGTAEVIQEALIRFWLSRDKLHDIQQPHAWLFRIVANECYRHFRQHGLQERLRSELEVTAAEASHQTEMDLAYRETRRIIHDVVAALPERHREIYRLSREEGLRMQEIADRTGLSFRYVKKVLMATLKIIREKLRQAGLYLHTLLL
jgi:RNA polymerase sigma-70 factor (family 1)